MRELAIPLLVAIVVLVAGAVSAWFFLMRKDWEAELWDSVKDSDDEELFEAYLKEYPNGRFAAIARAQFGAANSLPMQVPALAPLDLLDALRKVRPFQADAISRIIRRKLYRKPSNEYFTLYNSSVELRAELVEIELRTPTAKASVQDGLLILSINPKKRITMSDLIELYGREHDFNPAPPEAPRGEPHYITYHFADEQVRFGMSRQWTVVSIIIDRTDVVMGVRP